MANFSAHARSNYFAVKDLAAFREWAKTLPHIEISVKEAGEHAGKVMIRQDGGDGCGAWPTFRYTGQDQSESEDLDLPAELAKHLADGEVAVLEEVGNENLRYLSGHALAVNAVGKVVRVDLQQIYKLAKRLGPNVTRAIY